MDTNKQAFQKFVNGLYYDLGQPSDYPESRLSAWLLDSANIGKLNNLIGTCISGVAIQDDNCNIVGYNLNPYPDNDQLAIYKMLFDYEYFRSEARSTARSASSSGGDWISLKEGDSSISRVNKNEISKNFRALSKDAKEDLDKAVKMYLKYNAVPDQIVGDDTYGYSNYQNGYGAGDQSYERNGDNYPY